VLVAAVAIACQVPWQKRAVSSPIEGRLSRSGAAVAAGNVRLSVRSAGNPALGHNEVVPVGEDGGFVFDEVRLRVAGQEHSRNYLLFLIYREGDERRTLWRADYSRMRLGDTIELACDLDRPARKGPPCRLESLATDQPWLLDAGARDFQRLCESCHGQTGQGDGPSGAYLAPPPADLTRIAQRHGGEFHREAVADWIDGSSRVPGHGPRQMPSWGVELAEQTVPGGFTEELIRNRIDILVLYLETLQQPAGPR
jgi:hypothetical protein